MFGFACGTCRLHFFRRRAMGEAFTRHSLRPLHVKRDELISSLGRKCVARPRPHVDRCLNRESAGCCRTCIFDSKHLGRRAARYIALSPCGRGHLRHINKRGLVRGLSPQANLVEAYPSPNRASRAVLHALSRKGRGPIHEQSPRLFSASVGRAKRPPAGRLRAHRRSTHSARMVGTARARSS